MGKIYTDEFLISELQRFHRENDRVPTQLDMQPKFGYPSRSAYTSHFGSHNNALEGAGFKINQARTTNITKEFLINELHRFVDEYRVVPTIKNIDAAIGYSSVRPYITHFGTWDNALDIAKLYHNSNVKKAKIAECQVMNSLENAIHKSNENWKNEYDILCDKGYKVDVKSSQLYVRRNDSFRWQFHLKKDEVADYFFCLGYGYNDKNYENLRHVWKFKNENQIKNTQFITIQANNLYKWLKYEISLTK